MLIFTESLDGLFLLAYTRSTGDGERRDLSYALEVGTHERQLRSVQMSTILLVVLILLLIGALPTWPYSRGWGYYPSGGLGLIVLILLVLALTGRV